jgi:hypothetical protein
MLFLQTPQFQFLLSHVCSYTWIEQSYEQKQDLKVTQHSSCIRHCVILWCVSFIAWNQTRLIAQGRHLSSTSCCCFLWHGPLFLYLALDTEPEQKKGMIPLIRSLALLLNGLLFYSKFSSSLAQIINIFSLFVQLFDIKLDALQFLKRVFSVDTLVKPLPPVMAYSVSRNINFFFRIFTQFWGKLWWQKIIIHIMCWQLGFIVFTLLIPLYCIYVISITNLPENVLIFANEE